MDASDKPFLLLDGISKYDLYSQVKAYQINGKYFKKIFDPSKSKLFFYYRTAHGKIDAYKKASNKKFWYGDTPFMDNKWDLYSIDNGPLKKVKFRFLKEDLKASPEAWGIVKEIKVLRTLTVIADIGSIALCVATFQFAANSPYGGIVVIGFPGTHYYFLHIKRHKMVEAINTYNVEMKPAGQ